jgi:hypothetical protein
MKDPFARLTAQTAHARATVASKDAAETKAVLQAVIGQRPVQHLGRCTLCGQPARHRYCHAHSWAA